MNTKKIIKSVTNPYYTINSKYFTNTEGSEILAEKTGKDVSLRTLDRDLAILN